MKLDLEALALTLFALLAFAANSVLTRLALGPREIDAASFTALRLGAGALMLALLVRAQAGNWQALRWRGATGPLALLGYAAPFTFAYLRIGAAVGALVLFGTVQLTMIGYGIARGERPSPLVWVGLALAALGLALLTVPATLRPDPVGLMLMVVAGVAWAVYSLAGRTAGEPLAANARAFLWSAPLALALALVLRHGAFASPRGALVALCSGALTSGIGYAVWYRALPRLTVTQAAVAQLSVPVVAALGAVLFLGERLSMRLAISGAVVLGGVAIVLSARSRTTTSVPTRE
jgi:drug/metabolite transporter (DMT)-like permease